LSQEPHLLHRFLFHFNRGSNGEPVAAEELAHRRPPPYARQSIILFLRKCHVVSSRPCLVGRAVGLMIHGPKCLKATASSTASSTTAVPRPTSAKGRGEGPARCYTDLGMLISETRDARKARAEGNPYHPQGA